MKQQSLWAVPLGGLGEFGMNMLVLRYGDDMIVVDAGMMFPEAELLGVDVVIPDITFLKQNRNALRAIVLTHGHEDHIGALPYILRDINVPIYGTEYTLALVKRRLEEHGLLDQATLREVKTPSVALGTSGRKIQIGAFEIEYIYVTHSTIDCAALAIRTPIGVVIHTGDFKIDPTPTDLRPFDLHKFADYGQEGVLALFSDSTNVERAGYTPSERAVKPRLEELCRAAPRKVIVSCFASSIHRIQQVIEVAGMLGRKVGFVGRSMVDNVELSHSLSRLSIPDGIVVRPQDLKSFDPKKLVVLVSGSQAEPMSSLSRLAVDNHRLLSVDENDTVILSSRIIPGNEKPIFRMIDHMFRRRALIYYEDGGRAPIHVSGHASQEELKLVLNLVRPKYFIPIHGEYRMLFRHAALARQVGTVSGEIFVIEDGQPIEFTEEGAYRREKVAAGRVLVDSGSLEEIEEVVIRDRQHLSEDGVVVPIIAIDKHTGTVEGSPEIVNRGFLSSDDGQEVMAGAREVVLRTIEQSNPEEMADWSVIKEKIRVDLKRYLNKQTAKRPLILPVILEV
ncbi:MAG: ribonuclease J [Acidobacteria bacterium]|nr:ribonuclease J [Acidobacteriota bacterium]MBI3661631.1 ribonuclease J [Acidobacteriota bacterium]